MTIGILMELENSDYATPQQSRKSFSDFPERERIALSKGHIVRGEHKMTYWIDYSEEKQFRDGYKNDFWNR